MGHKHTGIVVAHSIIKEKGSRKKISEWYPGEIDEKTKHQWWFTEQHTFLLNMSKGIPEAIHEAYNVIEKKAVLAEIVEKNRKKMRGYPYHDRLCERTNQYHK